MSNSSYRPLHPFYRWMSAFLIVAHVVALQPVQIWAESVSTSVPATPTATAQRPAIPHATPPPPVKAVVNMTKPVVTATKAPAIGFSDNPSDAEFARCRLFAEPLLPIGGKTTLEENKAFAAAILSFSADPTAKNLDGLKGFLQGHPKSAWQVALLTNIGIIARHGCAWSEAMEDWQTAWKLGQKETDPTRSMIVDRSLGQLAELTARVGRVKELKALLAEVGSRNVRGPAAELLAEACQSLFLEESEPDKSFRCGPLAVGKVWAVLNPGKAIPETVFNSKCSANGSALTEVRAFAKTLGINLQMAKRSPGAPILYPSVVNWKVGHYAAITGRHDTGLYAVKDATFSDDFSVSEEVLDREASGYFLVRTGELPKGWQAVTDAEGSKVWGKGASSNSSKPVPPGVGVQVGCGGNQGGGAVNHGMAGYSIDPSRVNLTLSDTPLFYAPPHGPAIEFTASYSQRDIGPSSTPNYPNLGSQWNFNWVSFVVDDPNNVTTTTYGPGGGTLSYTGYSSTGANAGSFAQQALTHAILQRTSATSYVKYFPDGSRQVFNLADTSTPANVFMTEYDDPAGNVISYTYDPTTFRLLSVTDSLGQVSTLAYVSNDTTAANGDFYRVASVTDPFGRTATMIYDGSGRLSQIMDMAGFTSQFSYGAGDFINTLTTPYGNTTFVSNDSGSDRTLLATDPEGGSEYVWFVYSMNPPDSGSAVPSASGLLTNTSLNQYRTTYYWDKKAYMDAPGNFGAAHLYHFCHTPDLTAMSDIVESEKTALESRIYYNYPGQTSSYVSSNNNLPSKTARVMDDGSTQLLQMAYNANGKLTMIATPGNATTPSRVTTMTYAANSIDLVASYQENSSGQSVDSLGVAADLLGTFAYDPLGKHLVTSATDASGQTSTLTYNSYGQVLAVTNAKNETTTFTYDRDQDGDGLSDGYLINVTGPVAGATAQVQYDGFGRVYQTTDSEGYAVTVAYEAIGGVATKTLNRIAQLTFPDGTTTQILYDRFDPQWSKDRLGRWTETLYDNMERPCVIVDPLNRITQFQWCVCGSLQGMIDPTGNRTGWTRDVEHRVTQRTYSDGTSVTRTYENTTSRLKSVLDAKGQKKNYSYNIDSSLNGVSYTNVTGGALIPPTPSVSYTYEAVYGRMASITDGIGTTQYGYNAISAPPSLGAGRLASVDGPWSNDTVTYIYDELGRMAGRSINGAGNSTSLTYDDLGRVTGVTNPLGAFTYSYVDATARPSQVSFPNGQSTSFQYFGNTGDQRLREIKNQDTSGNIISQFDYSYNTVGDVQTWRQSNPTLPNPRQYAFGYDAGDQLSSASLTDTATSATLSDQAYLYDSAGNRTTTQNGNTIVTEQPNALNQLTQSSGGGMMRFAGAISKPATVTVGGNAATVNPDNTFQGYAQVSANSTTRVHVVATDSSNNVTDNYADITPNLVASNSYTYDLNGNTLSGGPNGAPNVTYGWDAKNHLVTITQGSNVTKFDYDSQGRRVRESLNGAEMRHWVWCGAELCEERDASNNVTKRFYGQGEQISGGNYYFTRDHLGSIREMMDASNVIHARYDYDLYGQPIGNSVTVNPVESDFGFTGHYYHANSGLFMAPFRAYAASEARWLSRDPIGENGGINLYGYVGGSPVSRRDPSGLVWGMDWLDNGAYDGYVQGVNDFTAGFAENVTMGISGWVQDRLGLSSTVNKCSGAYTAGTWAGFLIMLIDGEEEAAAAEEGIAGEEAGVAEEEACKTGCFLAGTLLKECDGLRRIEDVKLGDRVETSDPDNQDSTTEVNPDTWRTVKFTTSRTELGGNDGVFRFLRSDEWIKRMRCEVGGKFWLELPELGIWCWARVESVEPCPKIGSGKGRVVTGTMLHRSSEILRFHLENGEELCPTKTHRIYSETRQQWVAAADLLLGESLKTKGGAIRIVSIEQVQDLSLVYDIEVEYDHRYYVGGAEVLSHNGCLVPDLGRKLDYFFGLATGRSHNIERSTDMARQLASIGIHDTAAGRAYLAEHLAAVLNDASAISRIGREGATIRESLLMGPGGALKWETVWDGVRLLSGVLKGR